MPPAVDIEAYTTVVVWCETFGEFISAAKYADEISNAVFLGAGSHYCCIQSERRHGAVLSLACSTLPPTRYEDRARQFDCAQMIAGDNPNAVRTKMVRRDAGSPILSAWAQIRNLNLSPNYFHSSRASLFGKRCFNPGSGASGAISGVVRGVVAVLGPRRALPCGPCQAVSSGIPTIRVFCKALARSG